MFQTVAVLDFGSEYTALIVRRLRAMRVRSILFAGTAGADILRNEKNLAAVVLSGSPKGANDADAPKCDPAIFALGVPVLGVCYGAQLMALAAGGAVADSGAKEHRRAAANVVADSPLTNGLPKSSDVWMGKGARVAELPKGWKTLMATENCPHAAFALEEKKFYALQFHPEVDHTPQGGEILENFIYAVCGCKGDWVMSGYAGFAIQSVKDLVGDAKVVMGISGGVDSTVTAVMLSEALGKNLTCIFVDTGLLRKGEFQRVMSRYGNRFNIVGVQAGEKFLSELRGVTDPEKKRKIIGRVFVEIFQEEAKKIDGVRFLGQGTVYPDVIESFGGIGAAAGTVVKSHHNVGGLPEQMGLRLVEPLRELFKDEVRELGATLGIPEDELCRHPFPGPGLAVRIVGEITAERVAMLQEVDAIVLEEIHSAGWYRKLWQAFAVLLPRASVGVLGDRRSYESVAALRLVESRDGMTADWAEIPYSIIRRISRRVTSEVKGVNRVVYDVSSKPPATIEWE